MRDLAVLLILIAAVGLTFYRAWLGVLAMAMFAYLQPHTYATGFMNRFPCYEILFFAVCAAYLRSLVSSRTLPKLPMDWRIAAFLSLWAYFLFTTFEAKLPWMAWPRFGEVSAGFASLMFTLFLIDSRRKLFYLLVTIAAAFSVVTVKGGYWAVMTGFADRVYGPPGSHFSDNNHFAVAVIMNIPLLVLWLRETRHRQLRYLLMTVIGLSYAAALSSWSRGAVLALGATTLLLLWNSRHKYLAIVFLLAGIGLTFINLPEQWFERIGTIASYEQDGSAQSRLEVWRTGIKYAQLLPFTGIGMDGYKFATGGLDWHNAYVEIMAEHGFIAFGLWLSLLFGSIASLTRLAWVTRNIPELAWIQNFSQMLRASLVAYAIGSFFLGLSYWDILYQLIFMSIVLAQLYRNAVLEDYQIFERSGGSKTFITPDTHGGLPG